MNSSFIASYAFDLLSDSTHVSHFKVEDGTWNQEIPDGSNFTSTVPVLSMAFTYEAINEEFIFMAS